MVNHIYFFQQCPPFLVNMKQHSTQKVASFFLLVLKNSLRKARTTFVLSRGMEKCLTLYPMSSWEPIVEKNKCIK